jgi:hypothetical protein
MLLAIHVRVLLADSELIRIRSCVIQPQERIGTLVPIGEIAAQLTGKGLRNTRIESE